MIQKIYLTPSVDGTSVFDLKRLRDSIEFLDGIRRFREGEQSVGPNWTLFECELETSDEGISRIQIHVGRDLRSVTIDAYHDRGLQAAIEIQNGYGD